MIKLKLQKGFVAIWKLSVTIIQMSSKAKEKTVPKVYV